MWFPFLSEALNLRGLGSEAAPYFNFSILLDYLTVIKNWTMQQVLKIV